MSSGTLNLSLTSQTGRSGAGSATFSTVDPGSRAGKAAAFLIGGVALAGVCIMIPIVHLITTWLFPVLGAAMAWKTWTTELTLDTVDAACPECGAALGWRDMGARFPLRESCPSCDTQLQITRA